MTLWLVRALACSTLAFLVGCGDPIGSPCDFQGSGFTASDNCRHRCLVHRTIDCLDGNVIQGPKVCSGALQCNPGTCPQGQACYHVADPFKKESYCLPELICGQRSSQEISVWETNSRNISAELVAEWEEKQRRRSEPEPETTGPTDGSAD